MVIYSSVRQLPLQAYCTFKAHDGNEVYITLLESTYFTLFKFGRPDNFEPLPQEPDPQPKRQGLNLAILVLGSQSGERPRALETPSPLKWISMRYLGAPVLVGAQDRDLQLSDPFHLVLNDRLDGDRVSALLIVWSPGAQYIPSIEGSVCLIYRPSLSGSLRTWWFGWRNGSPSGTQPRRVKEPRIQTLLRKSHRR